MLMMKMKKTKKTTTLNQFRTKTMKSLLIMEKVPNRLKNKPLKKTGIKSKKISQKLLRMERKLQKRQVMLMRKYYHNHKKQAQ